MISNIQEFDDFKLKSESEINKLNNNNNEMLKNKVN